MDYGFISVSSPTFRATKRRAHIWASHMVGPALFASLCLGVKLRAPMPAPALASRRQVVEAAFALGVAAATAPLGPVSRAGALEDLDGGPPEKIEATCAPIRICSRVREHRLQLITPILRPERIYSRSS